MLPPREDSPQPVASPSSPITQQIITKEGEDGKVVTKSEEDQGGGGTSCELIGDDVITVPPEEEVKKEAEDLVKFEEDEKELEELKKSELKAVLQELVEVHDEKLKEKVENVSEKKSEVNLGGGVAAATTTTTSGGEGEVVEILTNLESLKTPEPHEVDDGIVRASFVDFVLEEDEDDNGCHGPIEEEDEDEEEDDEEMGQMNGVLNPELQKIREEQVRKWLIFEEQNPHPSSQSKNNNNVEDDDEHQDQDQAAGDNTLSSLTSIDADSLAGGRSGGMDDGEEVEEGELNGLDDGLQRRVRFLTDTEGNLLISVFMTKLVTLFLSIIKIASGGYLDYLSIAQPPSPSSSPCSTSLSDHDLTTVTTSTLNSSQIQKCQSQLLVENKDQLYEKLYASQESYSYSSSCSSADSFILLLEPPDHDYVDEEDDDIHVDVDDDDDKSPTYQNDSDDYYDESTSATSFSILIHKSTPTTPSMSMSEEPSMVSNNGGGEGTTEVDAEGGNPSLIVSPPSLTAEEQLEATKVETNLAKVEVAPTPSAPPQVDVELEVENGNEELYEEEDDDDDEEPPSIVLVAPAPPTSAPPTQKEEDEGGNSSDETLSVSSCNSMIEIMPQEKPSVIDLDMNNNNYVEDEVAKQRSPTPPQVETKTNMEVESKPIIAAPQANFHIESEKKEIEEAEQQKMEVLQHEVEELEEQEEEQPASLIIHDLEEHNEGFASQNGLEEQRASSLSPPIIKLPNIDENNNVVSESEADYNQQNQEEQQQNQLEQQFKFNPTLEPVQAAAPQTAVVSPIPMQMPELRRSSSDYGCEDNPERFTPPSNSHSPLRRTRNGSDGLGSEEDEDHSQMVSLCIQEEHISAVAVTIAKWESMSKAQSTENLSTIPPSQGAGGTHPPVAKTCSSPCPAKSVMMKPVGKLAPQQLQQNQQQQNQQVIVQQTLVQNNNRESKLVSQNNSQNYQEVPLPLNNPNPPVGTPSPVIVGKAAGWNAWGKGLAKEPEIPQVKKEVVQGGIPGREDDEVIYAQPNHSAGTTMTSIQNPSAILKAYPKPLSRGEIVNWLKEGEIHRAGIVVSYGQSHNHHHHPPVVAVQGQNNNNTLAPGVVNWFFGLISRQQAERYLHGQPPGTFLVRISTRIWGYTLSYQASTQRTKHFLISAINPAVPATLTAITDTNGVGPTKLPPQTGKQQRMSPFVPQGRYAFIGTNMTPYGTLVSLIRHHSHAPITKLGGEKLLNACPGGPQIQGLEQLFK